MTKVNEIVKLITSLPKTTISENQTEWLNLCALGKAISVNKVDIASMGFSKLRNLLEAYPDTFELYIDNSKKVPVVYVRLIDKKGITSSRVNRKPTSTGNSDIKNNGFLPLEDWAYLLNINEILSKLASMTNENWSFDNNLPPYPNHPILWSYLRYTFCRIQYQNKIVYSADSNLAAFNTGLYNEHYDDIIALFKRNDPGFKSEWIFLDFVIAGQGKGKVINKAFSSEIERATYTDNPADVVYDIRCGKPILDMDHLIKRVYRMPVNFLQQIVPDIAVPDSDTEKTAYFDQVRDKILSDQFIYQRFAGAINYAMDLAMKRIRCDHRNAVPMYYPKTNHMSFLIPLCLTSDGVVDIALVVSKTTTGKYEGSTILTLDWAYTDARLVGRPGMDWLSANHISGGNTPLI
jgi:hypothetical protein